jgi:hypothetical protein
MAIPYYFKVFVETSAGSGSYTEVPYSQTLTVDYGRSQPTDDFWTGQINVSGIYPDSLPSQIKEVGTRVKLALYATGGGVINEFYGSVQALSRVYGPIPVMDTWQLNAIGDIGKLAQQQLTSTYSTTAGTKTINQVADLLTAYGISYIAGGAGDSSVSANTFDIGFYINDIVQQIMRTEQGRYIDTVFSLPRVYSRSNAVEAGNFTYFTDGTGTPSVYDTPYTSLQFLNNGEFLANTVVVEPDGLTAQTVGTEKPALSFKTLDETTTQASDLAGYINNTIGTNTVRPLSVTVLLNAQTTNYWQGTMFPGAQCTVTLRGTTYNCVIEGATITADPSSTTVTFKLSSADAYAFLRLDDALLGTLDYNKLGF